MSRPPDSLTRGEKIFLAFTLAGLLGLGATTVARTAFMMNPKTDFQVYARAAWAVRTGADLYAVTDDNGWHYNYPPAFAILMVPLADPYPFMPHGGYLPLWLSAAIWWLIGLAAAIYSVHAFASAVVPQAPPGSRPWWSARAVPFFVCLGGIALTVTRGQVNTILVALVAAGFSAAMKQKRLASGAWLACAAVLKIIPAVLVIHPLIRRDWRALVGGLAMAALLLLVLPAAVWGIPGALEANRKTIDLVLAPVVSDNADHSRQAELHGANSTHSQSVQAAVHTWMYPDRSSRPEVADPIAKRIHLASVAAMVGYMLFAGWRRLTNSPSDQLLFLGCLCVLMMLATPISHLHYSMFVMPLVCGHWLRSPDRTTAWRLGLWSAITLIPALPWGVFEWMRTAGFGTAATLALWGWGLNRLGRSAEIRPASQPLHFAA